MVCRSCPTSSWPVALQDAGVDQADADALIEINAAARLAALQVAFAVAALVAIRALFFTRRIPTVPPGGESTTSGTQATQI